METNKRPVLVLVLQSGLLRKTCHNDGMVVSLFLCLVAERHPRRQRNDGSSESNGIEPQMGF